MKRVAIVGGGIAGLTAAFRLHRHCELTLFERSGRLGGNAYTHLTPEGYGVDIAVAAFGKAGYQRFYPLLEELGIRPKGSWGAYVACHDLDTKDGLYFTPGLKGLLAQNFALLNPRKIRSLVGVLRGVAEAQEALRRGELAEATVEQWLASAPRFDESGRIVLLCVLALLSSMSVPELLQAPASFFLRKLEAHSDVLSPKAAYSVRCVEGGTKRYVDALADRFRERIVLHSGVQRVVRSKDSVVVVAGSGEQRFDAVIFGCNADQALALLDEPTEAERRILGAWKYKEGRVVLHRDHSSFPVRDLTQAYTFLYTNRNGRLETSVNGALWRLPGVPSSCDYLSSQHPNFEIRPELIELSTVLRTPIFDAQSLAVQPELDSLNGARRSYYCGSHFGFGLHEDAVRSAERCAELVRAQILS